MVVLSVILFALLAATDAALELAVVALDRRDYTKAVELLETVIADQPDNHNARFNLAFAYTEIKQLRKAIEHYEIVVEQQPKLTAARANLSSLLIKQEEYSQAIPHLGVLADAWPNDFETQFFCAHAHLRSGLYEEAIRSYEKALALDSSSVAANLEIGQSLAKLGRFGEAAQYYHRAVEIEPTMADAILELAELVESDGQTKQAVALYRDHLKVRPEAIAVRERVGFLLLDLERFVEAAQFLEGVVKHKATGTNQAALAEAYSRQNQPEKALQAWRTASLLDPKNSKFRLLYADSLVRTRRYQDAVNEFLIVLEHDADLANAWNGLAFSFHQLGDFKSALRALNESRKRSGEKPTTLYLRAIVEDNLRMHSNALASYEAFLATNSGLKDEEWKSEQRIKTLRRILRRDRR